MRRSALLLLPLLAACAYYNGLYNAREAEQRADALARQGREAEAATLYAAAAEKAETVLTRYPKSRWRPDALYLAGRGAALGGRCDDGLRRIEEFLATPDAPDEREDRRRRERARLGAGVCLVRGERAAEALRTLEPLTGSASGAPAATRRDAAIWAARAATALGDHESAMRFLALVGGADAQWELVTASLQGGEYARAESLIAGRAAAGDLRGAATPALRTLWGAGRYDGVGGLVAAFDEARAPSGARARLHLDMGELALASGRADDARTHLGAARRLTSDTLVERRAEALLSFLAVTDAQSLDDADRALARSGAGQGTELHQRLGDCVILIRMLLGRTDPTGAAMFLAAEVARDSLRAPALALSLFTTLPETHPDSPVAPKALLAAAALAPDSAEAYRARVREQFRTSPYARVARGEGASGVFDDDDLLRATWASAVVAWGDSLRKLRPQSPVPGAAGAMPPVTP